MVCWFCAARSAAGLGGLLDIVHKRCVAAESMCKQASHGASNSMGFNYSAFSLWSRPIKRLTKRRSTVITLIPLCLSYFLYIFLSLTYD